MSVERERCLTCSDEAVAATVRSVDGLEAVVAVGDGTERVAIDLVPDARAGDTLLCHAGIALERLPGVRYVDTAAADTSRYLTPFADGAA